MSQNCKFFMTNANFQLIFLAFCHFSAHFLDGFIIIIFVQKTREPVCADPLGYGFRMLCWGNQ